VKRDLGNGIELDDDASRVDVDAVHAFLTRSYWAAGRTRDEVEAHVREASRVIGVYRDGRQVGYARVAVTAEGAGLFDVYVLAELRGRGVGVELVREAVEGSGHDGIGWWLRTRDAHGLYERFGFVRVDGDGLRMERPARRSACAATENPRGRGL
jgi:GNAT superfamily N-acetyltransferase